MEGGHCPTYISRFQAPVWERTCLPGSCLAFFQRNPGARTNLALISRLHQVLFQTQQILAINCSNFCGFLPKTENRKQKTVLNPPVLRIRKKSDERGIRALNPHQPASGDFASIDISPGNPADPLLLQFLPDYCSHARPSRLNRCWFFIKSWRVRPAHQKVFGAQAIIVGA
jgi:hypothetical protein